jgi:hypothetical protein
MVELDGLGAEPVGFTKRLMGDAGEEAAVEIFNLVILTYITGHGEILRIDWSVASFSGF